MLAPNNDEGIFPPKLHTCCPSKIIHTHSNTQFLLSLPKNWKYSIGPFPIQSHTLILLPNSVNDKQWSKTHSTKNCISTSTSKFISIHTLLHHMNSLFLYIDLPYTLLYSPKNQHNLKKTLKFPTFLPHTRLSQHIHTLYLIRSWYCTTHWWHSHSTSDFWYHITSMFPLFCTHFLDTKPNTLHIHSCPLPNPWFSHVRQKIPGLLCQLANPSFSFFCW